MVPRYGERGNDSKHLSTVSYKYLKPSQPNQPTESNFHPDITIDPSGDFTINATGKSTVSYDPEYWHLRCEQCANCIYSRTNPSCQPLCAPSICDCYKPCTNPTITPKR